MVALRGLLFAVFTLALTAVISLLVVGIIGLMFRIGHRTKGPNKTQKVK